MNKNIFLSVFLVILMLPVGLSAKSKQIDTFDQKVADAFEVLLGDISNFPDGVLSKVQLTSLDKKIENAESAYLRGQPCTAVNILRAYLNETKALGRRDENVLIEALYTKGWMLLKDLLAGLPDGKNCLPKEPNDGNGGDKGNKEIILEPDQTSNLGKSWIIPAWCGPRSVDQESLYQSFTPTRSSLAAVSLGLVLTPGRVDGDVYPATINIREVSPDGPIIGTTTVDVTPLNNEETLFRFSSPIPVTPGGTYVIEWITPSMEDDYILGWAQFRDNPYPDGNMFGCSGIPDEGSDLIFTTYAAKGS
jgi:hypothetical protein